MRCRNLRQQEETQSGGDRMIDGLWYRSESNAPIWRSVWSLRRGCINPPEPVDIGTQFALQYEARQAAFERDPPMTQEQWWMEEGRSCGYVKRKKYAA